MKEQILKEAQIEWGIKVGPKSNQRQQTIVLLQILSKTIDKTREETIRDILDNAIMYLKASDLSTFSKEYKQGYKDAFLDLERYKIKLKK